MYIAAQEAKDTKLSILPGTEINKVCTSERVSLERQQKYCGNLFFNWSFDTFHKEKKLAKVNNLGGDGAFYSPNSDIIVMELLLKTGVLSPQENRLEGDYWNRMFNYAKQRMHENQKYNKSKDLICTDFKNLSKMFEGEVSSWSEAERDVVGTATKIEDLNIGNEYLDQAQAIEN